MNFLFSGHGWVGLSDLWIFFLGLIYPDLKATAWPELTRKKKKKKAAGKPGVWSLARFDYNKHSPGWPIRATHLLSLNKVIGPRVTCN